ncbi:MAG TPA: hypothetical protein VFU47_09400 [Armatimonadota bacterium]|nr:hypothetical protein [Armatimonadota bacterium]
MNRAVRSLLAAAACAGILSAVPARADDDALRKELDALKARLEQVEKELAERKKAEAAAAQKPAPNADALKTRNGSRVQISGFAELRMTNIGSPTGDRVKNGDLDFQVTRFRPRINYTLDDHFLASLQLNASTRSAGAASVNTRDAWLEYHNAGYFARFGQQKLPFGFEVYRQGDETSPYLERARVFGMVFPDERDIGLVVGTTPRNPRAATFHLGVVNGDGINRSDGDADKSVAGKVELPVAKSTTVGASFYTGTSTVNRPAPRASEFRSLTKQALGAEYRGRYGRFDLRAEYLWGHAFGADLNGGYGYLGYDLGRIGNLFVRHDVFDPNEDAARDYWARTSLGWYKDFTKQFRLTAEYDLVRNKLTPTSNDNTFGVEFQANF